MFTKEYNIVTLKNYHGYDNINFDFPTIYKAIRTSFRSNFYYFNISVPSKEHECFNLIIKIKIPVI